jgi:hemerythrin
MAYSKHLEIDQLLGTAELYCHSNDYTNHFGYNTAMPAEISTLDTLHDALRQLTQQLHDCAQDDICSAFEQLLITAEKAFAAEQLLMERDDFPATRCHLEQHARVLSALHQAHPAVMNGDRNLAIHVGGHLLPEWFELHNSTLDAAVSVWASYRIDPDKLAANYGGQMINFAAATTNEAARPT